MHFFRWFFFFAIIAAFFSSDVMAKGGFSSGGSRGGGFSSSRSYSSGSYGRSYSSGTSKGYTSPSSVSRTTITRNYYGGGSGYYYHPYGMYGGMGMGYGYSNGLIEGMIIGNLMHPAGTTMYGGPGTYGNNALLYPNGMVVDQNGMQVGTYANGAFTAVQGGAMVAQNAPQNPGAAPTQVIVQQFPGPLEAVGYTLLFIFGFMLLIALIGGLVSWFSNCGDSYCETITTTNYSNVAPPRAKGKLKRQFKDGQPFVIDPVDNSHTWVNTNDDMYEDDNGDVWNLTND